MIDLNGMSVQAIAADSRVQAAVRRLDRLRDAEKLVAELSTKLMLAEHALEVIQREAERSVR